MRGINTDFRITTVYVLPASRTHARSTSARPRRASTPCKRYLAVMDIQQVVCVAVIHRGLLLRTPTRSCAVDRERGGSEGVEEGLGRASGGKASDGSK